MHNLAIQQKSHMSGNIYAKFKEGIFKSAKKLEKELKIWEIPVDGVYVHKTKNQIFSRFLLNKNLEFCVKMF